MARIGRRKLQKIKSAKKTESMYGVVIRSLNLVFIITDMIAILLMTNPRMENKIATPAIIEESATENIIVSFTGKTS